MNLFFLKIQSSKIAGNGVFTTQDIPKGKTITFLEGESCSLDELIMRVKAGKEEPSDPLQIDEETYIDLDELSRTFNHSCNPSTFIRGKNELIALRDINIGEEITFDYSTTMNDGEEKIRKAGKHKLWSCKCNCGSINCRGVIDQFKTLPATTKTFYLAHHYAPDFILRRFQRP